MLSVGSSLPPPPSPQEGVSSWVVGAEVHVPPFEFEADKFSDLDRWVGALVGVGQAPKMTPPTPAQGRQTEASSGKGRRRRGSRGVGHT